MAILKRKYSLDRRYGINTLFRKRSPFNSRPHVPGSSRNSRTPNLSSFGQALKASRVFRTQFGFIRKSQFDKVVHIAKKDKNISQSLVTLSGLRLISIIHRANWAATPYAAKQLISHGHVLVNGKKVTAKESILKIDDVVKLKLWKNNHVQQVIKEGEREIPSYLSVKDDVCTIVGHPNTNDKYIQSNLSTIIESYR